jgi:ankyrin repeat protein
MNATTSLDQRLVEAVMGKNTSAVMDLLGAGALPGHRDEDGKTPLHRAGVFANEEICKALIAHGADVNARDAWGNTPLSDAASAGRLQVCQALLSAGATADVRNQEQETPILMAARSGQFEVCSLLIQVGADPDAACFEGFTPLLWIAQSVPEEVDMKMAQRPHAGQSRILGAMELLVGAGARVLPNQKGLNALHWISSKRCDPSFLSALLPAVRGTATIDQQDSTGATPLFVAARFGNLAFCEMLLAAGANPLIDKKGVSAEEVARSNEHENIALTIKNHADAKRALLTIDAVMLNAQSPSRPRP